MTLPQSLPFTFAGHMLVAHASGALWWPALRMLVVADLHLGRSERYARRGGALLPPFEVTDTLDRLAAEIAALDPATIVSLGDGFDDDRASRALSADHTLRLRDMARGRDWIWITGNHDPDPDTICGRVLAEWTGPVTLRHEAGAGPDISGHYHPVLPLAGARWRAFLIGTDHLILPAFGTYTGGLDLRDPALRALVPKGHAIGCGRGVFAVPLPLPANGRR